MTPTDFDWRYPDFSVQPLGEPYPSRISPKQRVQQYVQNAPKRTLKKKPRTNYGLSKNDHYVWDNGMTFAEKAKMLAQMGVFGEHSRETPFTTDLDRYPSNAERVMDILRNSSSHVQKYYGVYDDIQAESKPMNVDLPGITVTGTSPQQQTPTKQTPRATRVRPQRSLSNHQYTPAPAAPVEPTVDLTGPTTEAALASAQLMQNRIPDYSPPMLAMQRGQKWSPVKDMNGSTIISRNSIVGNEYDAYRRNQANNAAEHGWGGWLLPL